MARLRYQAQQRIPGTRNGPRTLESQLNPDAELELSQRRRASLVPAETLYSINWTEPRHRVYQHYSEVRMLVTDSQQNLPLINQESYNRLRREGMQIIHLGLVMIRVHALHRRNAGTNALIVLRDTRWRDDRSIIGTMEIDLSGGTQLVYIAPNILISIEDFFHHIELAVQTHGYEDWNAAESNLLITRGLIARLTNTSHAGFRYNIQNVTDYLASNGIRAVPASPRTTAELQGMRWILKPPEAPQIRNPEAVRTTNLMDGSITLAFSGYHSTGNPKPRRMNEMDIEDSKEEVPEEEFAATSKNSPRWDTLGECSGKYDYYVDYSTPERPPEYYLPITPTGWDDPPPEEEECALPSIWEDTPWEDDPEWDLDELPTPDFQNTENTPIQYEEDEEDLGMHFLGLTEQEMDYPIFVQEEQGVQLNQEPNWESTDTESDLYWQQVVEHVEQIEMQLQAQQQIILEHHTIPRENGYYNPIPQESFIFEEFLQRLEEPHSEGELVNQTNNNLPLQATQNEDPEQEAAHVTTQEEILEQLEKMDYPIMRSLMNTEKALSSSAISAYNPPTEPLMGQINYPPAQSSQSPYEPPTGVQWSGNYKGKRVYQQPWVLPSAQQSTGVILVLPDDIGQYYNLLRISWEKRRKKCGSSGEWSMPENMRSLYKWQEKHRIFSNSGRAFLNPELSDKIFKKMPAIIGTEIEKAFKAKYPANQSFKKLSKTWLFVVRSQYQDIIKDHKRGHFARDCKRKTGNIVRAAVVDQLDLPSDYDILSVDLNEPDSDAICSYSEGEMGPVNYAKLVLEDTPWKASETIFMMGPEDCGWRSQELLPSEAVVEPQKNLAQPSASDEFFKIRRLTPTAKLPIRRTAGAAGYDIFLDEEISIPARMQALAGTGIAMEFSSKFYARLAPRSGAALKMMIGIGTGVIDSDFQGEVRILIQNHSDKIH
ncbi:uncharacterized protein LOC141826935 [Curcuma longa]|uniref:uncharacterized protein LOC141826935 n=1 Tax=Curcuma longa TaxID=136217 RepID=UPI003D9E1E65